MILTALGAIVSRNSIAIIACVALVGWATVGIKKHDQKVARVAVEEIKDQTRAKVQEAKKARRSVDPARADGVLDAKYCADCSR